MNIINGVRHVYAVIARSAILLCSFFMFSVHATSITLPYSFTAGGPISASQMMGNFTSITSAISNTVSSPWVASSSNIYFNTGSVGIGSSSPAYALDVSGSVNTTGGLYRGGVSLVFPNMTYRQGGSPTVLALRAFLCITSKASFPFFRNKKE